MIALARWLTPVVVLACAAPAQRIAIDGYAPREGRFLVEGEVAVIRVEGAADARLRATYRPGSSLAATEEIARDSSDGAFRLAPSQPGLLELVAYRLTVDGGGAEIEQPIDRKVVSVRFASALTLGVLVMAGAGLILFGGAFVSVRALMRKDRPPEP